MEAAWAGGTVIPEVLLLRWTTESWWIRLCAVAIGLGVDERVLDLQRISWRSEVVKDGWDMDGTQHESATDR